MAPPEPERGASVGAQLRALTGLTARVVLAVFLLIVLHLVGAALSSAVVITGLVAIFGQGLLPPEFIQIGARKAPASAVALSDALAAAEEERATVTAAAPQSARAEGEAR